MIVRVRDGFAPYAARLSIKPTSASWSFMLSQAATARFAVSRDRLTPDVDAMLDGGTVISIEEVAYPWAGYITRVDDSSSQTQVGYECQDHAGWKFANAHNRIAAEPELLDPAQHIENAMHVGKVDVGLELARGGSRVAYTPLAEPVSDTIANMVDLSGWEWQLRPSFDGRELRVTFVWAEEIGAASDVHLKDEHILHAQYTRDARGYAGQALAIGGQGVLDDRPRAERVGAVDEDSQRRIGESPALGASRVLVDVAVGNEEALETAAAYLLRKPGIAESVVFRAQEPERMLSLGSVIGLTTRKAGQGRLVDRKVRIMALQFIGDSGEIDVVGEVLPRTFTTGGRSAEPGAGT